MRNLVNTVDNILGEIPAGRINQDFISSLVDIRDIAPFIPEEAISFYWSKLTELVIETLHPELGGIQDWEQQVINKLLGV